MSGKQENDPMNERDNNITDEQHERLCAYVFGELEGDERAAFEAELAGSPELQAEQARLEATASFVQANLGGDVLSPEVQNTLRAAAEASAAAASEEARPAIPAGWRFLRGGGALRLAAGFALVFGAAFAWNVFQQSERASSGPETVALLEKKKSEAQDESALGKRGFPLRRDAGRVAGNEVASARKEDERPREQNFEAASRLRDIGYVEVESEEAPQDAAASAAPAWEAGDKAAGFSIAPSKPAQSEADRDAQVAQLRRALEDLGYAEVADAPPASEPTVSVAMSAPDVGGFQDESLRAMGYSGGGDPGVSYDQESIERMKSLGYVAEESSPYRGPGDTGPPSGGERRAYDAQPSAKPQAAAPTSPSVTGSDGWFLGRSGGAKDGEARREAAPRSSRVPVPIRPGGASTGMDADDYERRQHRGMSDEDFNGLVQNIIGRCRVLPNERPRDMFFRYWGDNPFVLTTNDTLSTFAIDVDTASYGIARNYLNRGQLPPKEAVRTEELVNYFKADAPAPAPGATFGLGMELAPNPFNADPNSRLLRVTVRGKDVDAYERQPLALTFVIDVSGSMKKEGRLELVKRSLFLLTSQLSSTDSIAIIAFNENARLVSHMTSAANRSVLQEAIQGMSPGGGTNVGGGLELGYRVAAEALTPNAVNRVVLLSDGVGNVGDTDAATILDKVRDLRAKGIYLNTLGVGMGNHNDTFLEQLADAGDGQTNYIDSDREAKRALVDNFTGTFQPIARDVKVQMAFNPVHVERWRQLGYENRKLAHADFRNDAIDAGEVNAGHQVTALYELILNPSGDSEDALASLNVRFKPPFSVDSGREDAESREAAEVAKEIRRDLVPGEIVPTFEQTSLGYRRSVIVAQFAELLRRSVHSRDDSIDELATMAHALRPELRDTDFDEFLTLVEMARPLLRRERIAFQENRTGRLLDELCRLHYLEGLRNELEELSEEELEQRRKAGLEYQEALEREITELLREKYQSPNSKDQR